MLDYTNSRRKSHHCVPFFAWDRSFLDVILTTMNRTDRPLLRDMCQCMFLLLYVPVVVLSAYQPFLRRKILYACRFVRFKTRPASLL